MCCGYLCRFNNFSSPAATLIYPSPLTGCHLLASYFFVAPQTHCIEHWLLFEGCSQHFSPLFLLFHSHPPATMLKHKHLNKSEDENVREQREKNRAREAILFLFSSESGTVSFSFFFLYIYSTDLSSVADHTSLFLYQYLVLNHKWRFGNGYKCLFQSL